jgi:hypothetical protein
MVDLKEILLKREHHRNDLINPVGQSVLKTPTDPSLDPSADFIC